MQTLSNIRLKLENDVSHGLPKFTEARNNWFDSKFPEFTKGYLSSELRIHVHCLAEHLNFGSGEFCQIYQFMKDGGIFADKLHSRIYARNHDNEFPVFVGYVHVMEDGKEFALRQTSMIGLQALNQCLCMDIGNSLYRS